MLEGYRIGGKTGTGEKRDLSEEEQNGNYVVSLWG
jgi:cell division protein FtsI/penicillin-binding protein 2